MQRNMKKWIADVLATPERKALPIVSYPGGELTGATVNQIACHAELQFDCIQALLKRFPDAAAAITSMDLSTEAETFGSPVRFEEHEIPTVHAPIVHNQADVDALQVPKAGLMRTGEYLKAVELCVSQITDRPTFGGAIGPFSLAGRLMDINHLMVSVRRDPELVHSLLVKCTQYLVDYLQAFKRAGAHGVIVAEPTAGLLSPAMAKTFGFDYVKQIVDAVQDENFVFILHNCGHAVKQVDAMVETGAWAFHFGNVVDMVDILPQIPSDRLVFGNIDPSNVMSRGDQKSVRDHVVDLLIKTASYENFVLSTGCDVPPGSPLANIDEFYATLADFNRMRVGAALHA